ncbi:MAG: hypothetical protein KBS81_08435, partial [Spirochaetales bacterium]|nr:hypothetical protein [Candidatus Physcosoma equi]
PQNGSALASTPFIMNELGRKERMFPFDDGASLAVNEYSKGEINGDDLRSRLFKILKDDSRDKVLFLNVEQLVLGALRTNDIHRPGDLVVEILEEFQTCSLSEMEVTVPGYLGGGWYGRDAYAYGFRSFNEVLVENENFRYLYNRYISLAEGTQTRNNRFLKKDVTTALFSVATGPLFIHDAQMAPLRYKTRRNFWHALLEAEAFYQSYTDTSAYREYDLEDNGHQDLVMANSTYMAIVSPKGGSLPEFDFLPDTYNVFDTRAPFDRNEPKVTLNKSFSDVIRIGDQTYRTGEKFFSVEPMDKKRTEVQCSLKDKELPLSIQKHYKLRSSTFILDVTLTNDGEKKVSGTYSNEVYLGAYDAKLVGSEQRMDMVTNKVVTAKTVKYGSKLEQDLQFIFSSTRPFQVTEEYNGQKEPTVSGTEESGLWKKIVFTFPLEVEVG